MKHFFYVVFGGITAVACGILIAFVGRLFVVSVIPKLANINLSFLADSIVSQPIDGTSISGLKRTVRYTASEEEGLMSAATLSLPNGSINTISADAYMVKDLKTGKVIAESNPNKLLPIASLTKLVTAVVAKRLIDGETKVQITREIINTYGNTAQFKIGETFRAGDLSYPLLMDSSNDAAEALAKSYGRVKFIKTMNDFVQSIGAYRTTFYEPSGLSASSRSTVNDIAVILDWIRINEPEIMAITETKTKVMRSHTWTNPAHFLSWSNYLGGKNGYTDEADQTGAMLFEMGDKKDVYAVIVLGSNARDGDVVKLLAKISE
ncbi:MAG: serine hydrolase [Candidatus Paceibacterota bacterium]